MTSFISKNEESFELTKTLQKQLIAYSTSSEISKIIAQAKSIKELFNELVLGFRDLAGYSKVIILSIDPENFCLKPIHSVGFDEEKLKGFCPEINFTSGEYADAIFLNKHILVEPVPDFDAFSLLGSKAYTIFPIVTRITDECQKVKKCEGINCPCYNTNNSKNEYCYTNPNAGYKTNSTTEDDRRRVCVKCKQFKCENLIWLDLTYNKITGEDIAMIYSVVSQTGIILEAFKAYEALVKTNKTLNETYDALQKVYGILKTDLQQASLIQQQLLPTSFPSALPDVSAEYKANLYVGGDYYDCFELDENSIAFVIADVSGHGVAAAMLMSIFKTMLKSSSLNATDPAKTLEAINKTLIEINTGKFITVFYAVWFKETRELMYTNAGHHPILLLNKNTKEMELLKSSGPFIGMLPGIRLENKTLKLEGEHRLNLYTDGINEAKNDAGEEFGNKRIYDLMINMSNKSCKEFINILFKNLDDFYSGRKLVDDATMLVCDL